MGVRTATLAPRHLLLQSRVQVTLRELEPDTELLLRVQLLDGAGPDPVLARVVYVAELLLPVLREAPLLVLTARVRGPLPRLSVPLRAGRVEDPLVVVREVGVARG